MSDPVCTCAMTEGSQRRCPEHGEDDSRPVSDPRPDGLTATERATLERVLMKVSPAQVPMLRRIHQDALDKLWPQLAATSRAIAMREASLQILAARTGDSRG